jgi:hypothetical protein
MTASVLVAQLRARGLRLRVEGETLLVSPRGRLTAEEREGLRGQKAAVLAVLEVEMADPAVALALEVFGARLVGCPRCGGDRWRPDLTGDGERCTTCDCWSPCSLPLEGPHACGRGVPSATRHDVATSPARKPAQPKKEEDDEERRTELRAGRIGGA